MGKKDYFDDPAAPRPNSLVVAVTGFVQDEEGRVLMIQRTDNGLWALPGGAQDLGETTSAALVREVREETGILVDVSGLVGIYSDPRHVIAYDDGEIRQEFAVCLRARPVDGVLATSDESRQVHWLPRAELDGLTIHPRMRVRIEHGLQGGSPPHVD